jgi:GST-like protein
MAPDSKTLNGAPPSAGMWSTTYRLIRVDIGKGEQFHPQFLAISPNNKIPAIVDHMPADGGAPLSVFESGAILLYLAEKSGKLLRQKLRMKLLPFANIDPN